MNLNLSWGEIALRLALTVAVGIVVGYNRSQHGKIAGMSTSVLVCVAAAVAMIQVNLLLPTAGRPPTSFVMNDLMRLPLGILTGVGFIGAGAIMRRESLVVGVTTAATLWLLTVIGLCLGGGQIVLGLVAALLCLFALWALKGMENHLRLEHRATLRLELEPQGPEEAAIRKRLRDSGFKIAGARVRVERDTGCRRVRFEIRYMRRVTEAEVPPSVQALVGEKGVRCLDWRSLS